MPPVFNPRLVNDPAGDPGLFVPFFYERRALLFDAGDLSSLFPRDILKITHVFITHTHMDHFTGFDTILRICLGRQKNLYFFGPEGFLDRVEAKLSAYTWNLVHNYENTLRITATEIRENVLVTREFNCHEKFAPGPARTLAYDNCLIYFEPVFKVEAAILDHDIASMGYALRERFSVNIRKEVLEEMKLKPGPWLYEFKQALYKGKDLHGVFKIPSGFAPGAERLEYTLQELADRIAVITPGRKITYIADAAWNDENIEKMLFLAKDADHLFIEGAFLDEDKDIARLKKHLTARQAGRLAAAAGAKRFTLFHFSPRYSGNFEMLVEQARVAASDPENSRPLISR
jgi:ribonuclease Z